MSVSGKAPGRDVDGRPPQDNPEQAMAVGGGSGKEGPEWCSQPESKLWTLGSSMGSSDVAVLPRVFIAHVSHSSENRCDRATKVEKKKKKLN